MSVPVVFVPVEGGAGRARASRLLARTLKRAGATSVATAAPLRPATRGEERMLRRLVHEGVIRHGRNGGYWLDEQRYRDLQRARWRIVAMILLVEGGIIAALALNLPRHPH